MAQHQMDLVPPRIEIIEQPLRVNGSAGPGHGDEDFQTPPSWHCSVLSTSRQARQAFPGNAYD
jgi:hypothetical protein